MTQEITIGIVQPHISYVFSCWRKSYNALQVARYWQSERSLEWVDFGVGLQDNTFVERLAASSHLTSLLRNVPLYKGQPY